MTECRFDNGAYPNLCMAHFAIDGKDHGGCLCDEGVAALVQLSIQEKLKGAGHLGDPCIYCGLGHEDVPSGICLATRDVIRTERDILRAHCKTLREALQKAADTFSDLRQVSDLLGRSLTAESCKIAEEATKAALAAQE